MKLSKFIARNIVFPPIVSLGFDRLLYKTDANNLLNIYYHGVVNKDSNYFSPRHMHIKQFEQQMKYVKKHFDIITVQDAFDVKNRSIKLDRPTVTISFDDGYQNNLLVALPILKKYNIKTTFFISGVCFEDKRDNLLWTDVIAFAKYFCRNEEVSLQGVKYVSFMEESSGLSMKDYLKDKPRLFRDQSMDELIEKCDLKERMGQIPEEIWRLLNTSELKELAKEDIVDIGSHGYNHYNLGHININEAIEDMKLSKMKIEDALGKQVNTICYPDGSYTMDVLKAASTIGYKNSVCCDYASAEDRNLPNLINRHGVSNTTTYASNIFFINKSFKTKGI